MLLYDDAGGHDRVSRHRNKKSGVVVGIPGNAALRTTERRATKGPARLLPSNNIPVASR